MTLSTVAMTKYITYPAQRDGCFNRAPLSIMDLGSSSGPFVTGVIITALVWVHD